jgi:hypothetical protein
MIAGVVSCSVLVCLMVVAALAGVGRIVAAMRYRRLRARDARALRHGRRVLRAGIFLT